MTKELETARPEILLNSLFAFAGQLSTRALAFLSLVILARYLTIDEFGRYNFAFAVGFILAALCDLGIDVLATREVARDKDTAKLYLSNILSIRAISFFLILALSWILSSWLQYPAQLKYIVLLAFITVALNFSLNSVIAIFRAYQRLSYEAFLRSCGSFAVFLGIVLAIFARLSLNSIILFQLAMTAITFLTGFVIASRYLGRRSSRLDPDFCLKLLKESLPFGITQLLTMISFRIDTVLLSKIIGDEAVGFYNAAYNLVFGAMIISTSLVAAFFPVISAEYFVDAARVGRLFRDAFKYLMLLGLPITMIGTVMARSLLELLYGPAYGQAASALAIIIWTVPVIFLTYLLGNALGAINRQQEVAWIAFVNASFNLGLNLWLIPQFSYVGSALATLLTETLGLILLLNRSSRFFPFPKGRVLGRIVFSSFASLVSLLLSSFGLFVVILGYGLCYVVLLRAFKIIESKELIQIKEILRGTR